MDINRITKREVELLEADELVTLLEILIAGELGRDFLPTEIDKSSVPRPILMKDGGEDAFVKLAMDSGKELKSEFFKNQYTTYQCKATNLSPDECRKEIKVTPKGTILKPRINDCVDQKGEYVLVTRAPYSTALAKKRVDSIRVGLAECGIKDAASYPVRIFDANELVKFANRSLPAIIYVQQCRGVTRPQQFQNWSYWKQIVDANKKYIYQESIYLADNATRLLDSLEKEKVVRVVGHKGIGKTRFVLETFNPLKNNLVKNLSDRLVYIDLAFSDAAALNGFILSNSSLDGIIVIDNCPNDWHQAYAAPVNARGNLRIITLNDSQFADNKWIWLERTSQRATVRLILENLFPSFDTGQIDHLLQITEGFPEMIPFIERALNKSNPTPFFSTIQDDLINKFIFPKDKDQAEYDLFRACAVFSEFTFVDDKIKGDVPLSLQAKAKKQNELIYTKIVDNPTTEQNFYKFCKKYRDKRPLLERKGYLYSVIPIPIAVNLAAEWWEDHSFGFVEDLLGELNDSDLLIPMMDMVRILDQSDRAQGIAGQAWGPNGPFVTAEVINTELGSRLFRSVVEVNPEATLQGVELTFEEFSIEDFRLKVTKGRRNLVWALEKLAFRKETFEGAAKLLLKLGAGENENFGNNATAQFLQLFHIQLPGTEANFESRLNVIDWGYRQTDPLLKRLAILAMGSGLRSHGFSRMGGAERQGLSTFLKDYQPAGWGEIANYWIAIIQTLTQIAIHDTDNKQLAKNTIAGSIRSMFSNNLMPIIKDAITSILDTDNSIWESAIKSLKQTKSYESNTPEEIETINHLISRLSPENLADKIQLTVILPIWDYSPENLKGEITQKAAEKLAEEIEEQKTDITPLLPELLTGEQRQTFNFGAQLAKSNYNVEKLIADSLKILKEIPKDKQNPALIGGIIWALDKGNQLKVLSQISNSPEISFQKFHLIRLTDPTFDELTELFDLVDKGEADVSYFSALQYGRMLDNLQVDSIISICERISKYGQKGAWTALLIVGTYYFHDQTKWNETKAFVRKLTIENNFVIALGDSNQTDGYHWGETVKRLLDGTFDEEYAATVGKQFAEAMETDKFPYFDHSIKEITTILFQQYFDTTWPYISEMLLSTNGRSYLASKEIIGSSNGVNQRPGLLIYADVDFIINWIKINGERALRRISNMMPLFSNSGWHPFGRKMIDVFGENEGFLDEVAANLGSFGMVGTSEGYYSTIIGMLKELEDHPFSKVRKWAKNGIQSYERQIRAERLQDESRK